MDRSNIQGLSASAVPLDTGDFLHVEATLGGVVDDSLRVIYTVVGLDGKETICQDIFTAVSGNQVTERWLPLYSGWLVYLAVYSSFITQPGKLHILVDINYGGQNLANSIGRAPLIEDYCFIRSAPTYPPINVNLGIEQKYTDTQLPANPAVGVDFIYTVPQHQESDLLGVFLPLVTSGTVANRVMTLDIITNTGARIYKSTSNFPQAASLTRNYLFFCGHTVPFQIVPYSQEIWPAVPFKLMAGYVIRTVVTLLDAGDQISGIRIYMRTQTRRSF